jgi:hypothetical protein
MSTKEHSHKEYSRDHSEYSFKEHSSNDIYGKEPSFKERSILPSSSLSLFHPPTPLGSKPTEVQGSKPAEVQEKVLSSEIKHKEMHVSSHDTFQQLIARLFRNLSKNNLRTDPPSKSIITHLALNLKAAYTFFRSEVYI